MTEHYLLPVWDTIGISWKKVSGAKASFWGMIAITLVIMIAFGILQWLFPVYKKPIMYVSQFISYIIQMGFLYMGIKRAQDAPISYDMGFHAFRWPILWRIVILYLLQVLLFLPFTILMIIGFVCLGAGFSGSIALGILLIILGFIGIFIVAVRMCISSGLVVDKIKGPREAITLSFRATRFNFWHIVGLSLLQMLIILISIIPLGIGLIWSIPFAYIVYGTMYTFFLRNIQEDSKVTVIQSTPT